MANPTIMWLILSILYVASPANSATTSSPSPSPSPSAINFIKASCSVTRYPALCVQSLSQYATSIKQNRTRLIQKAFFVSLDAAHSSKTFVYNLTKLNLDPREMAAVNDCSGLMYLAVGELRQSIKQLKDISQAKSPRDKQSHISNIQTWTSAALTDVNTCMDGLEEQASDGWVKTSVTERMVGVAGVTSNALALVNNFGTEL